MANTKEERLGKMEAKVNANREDLVEEDTEENVSFDGVDTSERRVLQLEELEELELRDVQGANDVVGGEEALQLLAEISDGHGGQQESAVGGGSVLGMDIAITVTKSHMKKEVTGYEIIGGESDAEVYDVADSATQVTYGCMLGGETMQKGSEEGLKAGTEEPESKENGTRGQNTAGHEKGAESSAIGEHHDVEMSDDEWFWKSPVAQVTPEQMRSYMEYEPRILDSTEPINSTEEVHNKMEVSKQDCINNKQSKNNRYRRNRHKGVHETKEVLKAHVKREGAEFSSGRKRTKRKGATVAAADTNKAKSCATENDGQGDGRNKENEKPNGVERKGLELGSGNETPARIIGADATSMAVPKITWAKRNGLMAQQRRSKEKPLGELQYELEPAEEEQSEGRSSDWRTVDSEESETESKKKRTVKRAIRREGSSGSRSASLARIFDDGITFPQAKRKAERKSEREEWVLKYGKALPFEEDVARWPAMETKDDTLGPVLAPTPVSRRTRSSILKQVTAVKDKESDLRMLRTVNRVAENRCSSTSGDSSATRKSRAQGSPKQGMRVTANNNSLGYKPRNKLVMSSEGSVQAADKSAILMKEWIGQLDGNGDALVKKTLNMSSSSDDFVNAEVRRRPAIPNLKS